MTDSKLEQRIRDHYEAQKLSPEAIDRLNNAISGAQKTAAPRRKTSRWLAIAAAALIVVIGGAVLLTPALDPEKTLRAAIAQEAARDHNLRLATEVPTGTYADLRARMARLQFSPVEPDSLKSMNLRLLGARHGSLLGQPAVQIKLSDARGEICTLIQARPVDRLARVDERTQHHIDGLLVDVWREKGLVMVLTRPIA